MLPWRRNFNFFASSIIMCSRICQVAFACASKCPAECKHSAGLQVLSEDSFEWDKKPRKMVLEKDSTAQPTTTLTFRGIFFLTQSGSDYSTPSEISELASCTVTPSGVNALALCYSSSIGSVSRFVHSTQRWKPSLVHPPFWGNLVRHAEDQVYVRDHTPH